MKLFFYLFYVTFIPCKEVLVPKNCLEKVRAVFFPKKLVSLLGISALIRNLRKVLHKSITEYDNHVVELILTLL